MNKFPNEIDSAYFSDTSKVDDLLELVKNPRNLIRVEDESRLFEPPYKPVMFEYLRHHSLYEGNQWQLFVVGFEDIMELFLQKWVLGSIYEQKLCSAIYRDKWLCQYLEYHNFADSDNELLLFGSDMTRFRRFYIRQTDFHNRRAELKLFDAGFKEDLRLYVELRRKFFPEHIHFVLEGDSEIANLYKHYNKY